MLKHFKYCRKSSKGDDQQVLSIEAQRFELEKLAGEEGRLCIRTFEESMSAKEPGRPVFNEMMQRIENGEANAILAWKLDRLARNFDDGAKIIGLLQRGVIQEIRTFEKTYLPSDNVLMIAVELGMANQYVRDLSVNIRRGIREKIRRGVLSAKAPLGYFNEPNLRTIEPHPENFTKVKRIFEMFATGAYTLTAIRKEMTKLGIVGGRSRKPLPLSSLGRMFNNPFYYGVFTYKGELHQGSHTPMITKENFDEVQAALIKVGRPRKRRGERGLLFLHFATCASCGYSITAERKTKRSGRRYIYYHCTHKSKTQRCEERGCVRQERFQEEMRRNVSLVALPDEWREKFLAKVETWETDVSEVRQVQVERFKSELAALKIKTDRINTAFTEGGLDIAEFKEMKNPLVVQKTDLEQRLAKVEKGGANRLEPVRNWILEANQAKTLAFGDDWLEMKSFLQKVGSNRLVCAQTLTVTFKNQWHLLAETTLAVQRTNDVSAQSSEWWSLGDSNP